MILPRRSMSWTLMALVCAASNTTTQAPPSTAETGSEQLTPASAIVTAGNGERVQAIDLLLGGPFVLSWSLANKGAHAEGSPAHAYSAPGPYPVALVIAKGSSTNRWTATAVATKKLRKHLGTAPPAPTPTPIPPATLAAPAEMTSDVLSALGRVGTISPSVSLDSLVATALTVGVSTLVDMAVAADPGVVTRIPNGVRWDFGDGYTNFKGTYTGTVDLTHGNVQTNGNSISVQSAVQSTNFTKNGVARPFDHATGSISAQQGANGKTTGTVTLDGGGTITIGSDSDTEDVSIPLTGNVQFDTSRCARYPIAGGITTDYSALVRQPTDFLTGSTSFNSSCDGTFQYSGPAEVLLLPPVIESPGCELGWFGAMWLDILSVSWNGTTFQGSVSRSITDEHGVIQLDQTTVQGTLLAGGQTVAAFQVDSYMKATYPVGYSTCPAGGCTSERWVSAALSNLPRSGSVAFFDTYGGDGTAWFASWSDRVLRAGWPDPAKNYDCTYPIDLSKPTDGGAAVYLVRP